MVTSTKLLIILIIMKYEKYLRMLAFKSKRLQMRPMLQVRRAKEEGLKKGSEVRGQPCIEMLRI